MTTANERSRRRSCPQTLTNQKGGWNTTRSTKSVDLLESHLRSPDENITHDDSKSPVQSVWKQVRQTPEIQTKAKFYQGDYHDLNPPIDAHKQNTPPCRPTYNARANGLPRQNHVALHSEICHMQGQGDTELTSECQHGMNDVSLLAPDRLQQCKSSDDTRNGTSLMKYETINGHDEDIIECQLREIYANEMCYKDCDVTFDSISDESDDSRSVVNDLRNDTSAYRDDTTGHYYDIVKTDSYIRKSPTINHNDGMTRSLDTQRTEHTKAVLTTHIPTLGDITEQRAVNTKCADERKQLRTLVKNKFIVDTQMNNEDIYDNESRVTDSCPTNGVSRECARILSMYTHSGRTSPQVNDTAQLNDDGNPLLFTKGIGLMNVDAAHLKTWLLKLLWDSESLLNVNSNNSNNNQHNNRNNATGNGNCQDNVDYDDDIEGAGHKGTYNKKACVYRAFLISSLSHIISAIDSLLKLVEYQNENQTELMRSIGDADNLSRFKQIVRVHIGQSINTISDIASMLQGLVNHGKSASTQFTSTCQHDRLAANDIQMWYRSPKEFVQGTGLFGPAVNEPLEKEEILKCSQPSGSGRRNMPHKTVVNAPDVHHYEESNSQAEGRPRQSRSEHSRKANNTQSKGCKKTHNDTTRRRHQPESDERSSKNIDCEERSLTDNTSNESPDCFIVKTRNYSKTPQEPGLAKQTTTVGDVTPRHPINSKRYTTCRSNDPADGVKNIASAHLSDKASNKKTECKDNHSKYPTRSTKAVHTSVDTRSGVSCSGLKSTTAEKTGDSLTARIAAARQRVQQTESSRLETSRKDVPRTSPNSHTITKTCTVSNDRTRKSKLAEPKPVSSQCGQPPSGIPRPAKTPERKDSTELARSAKHDVNTIRDTDKLRVRNGVSQEESDVTTSEDDAWRLAREDTDGSQPSSGNYFLAQTPQLRNDVRSLFSTDRCASKNVSRSEDRRQGHSGTQSDSDQTDISYKLAPSTPKYGNLIYSEAERSLDALHRQMAAVSNQREMDRKSLSIRSSKATNKATVPKRFNSGQDAVSKQRQHECQSKKVSSSHLSPTDNPKTCPSWGKHADTCGEGSSKKIRETDRYWRSKHVTRGTRRNQYATSSASTGDVSEHVTVGRDPVVSSTSHKTALGPFHKRKASPPILTGVKQAKRDDQSCVSTPVQGNNTSAIHGSNEHSTALHEPQDIDSETSKTHSPESVRERRMCSRLDRNSPPEVIRPFRRRGFTYTEECFSILNAVYNHPLSTNLRAEVKSRLVPDYYKIVKCPMFLDIIACRLRQRLYHCRDDFVHDMRRAFWNCKLYHQEGNQAYDECIQVESHFNDTLSTVFADADFSAITGSPKLNVATSDDTSLSVTITRIPGELRQLLG